MGKKTAMSVHTRGDMREPNSSWFGPDYAEGVGVHIRCDGMRE
jgi:hypothetical protein